MVCILDADKEGFLRSETSLIQTIGRSARQRQRPRSSSTPTRSPTRCSGRSTRPTAAASSQLEYNAEHGITPETIVKAIRRGIEDILRARKTAAETVRMSEKEFNRNEAVVEVEKEMYAAAEKLDFERAAAAARHAAAADRRHGAAR